jgi:hypothetical protein
MMKKTDAPRRWMAKVRVKFRYSWCIVRLVYYRHLAEIVDRLPLGGLPWLRFCYPVLRPTATSVRWHGFEELRQRRSTASTGLISVTAVVSIAGRMAAPTTASSGRQTPWTRQVFLARRCSLRRRIPQRGARGSWSLSV